MSKVFLGGTCNGSLWRNRLIPILEKEGITYFNPVVADWNEAAQEREKLEKLESEYNLFCFTPLMDGFFSIAEVIDCVYKRPQGTIICILPEDNSVVFTPSRLKSLEAVAKMVVDNGGLWSPDLETIVDIVKDNIVMQVVHDSIS